MFRICKNKDPRLCKAHGCKNNRSGKDPLCPKHRHRYNKENDHCKYVYNTWLANCRRRGIENLVTLEEFRKWCRETDYLEKKGRKHDSYTIDRIKSELPYTIDNMQIMNHWENSFKQDMDDVPF